MRPFLTRVTLLILIPVVVLAFLYCITDPYKTLRPFSLDYFDATNRDFLSSELFLMNYPKEHYDSYIFGSSRGCGINTYHWKKYLPEGARQFLFQGWSETLTGIEEKIDYIDQHGYALNNVIVLIDIPGTFDADQTPTKTMTIRDPVFTGQSHWLHQFILFFNYLQKPSQWCLSIRCFLHKARPYVGFDTISNDWDKNNKDLDVLIPPEKDSLKNMSAVSRKAFLKTVSDRIGGEQEISEPLIHGHSVEQLGHIKAVFDKRGTDYRIVITPGFYFTTSAISHEDETLLRCIFGDERVFNYSGKNSMTVDFNNFSDSGHFGLYVGWFIIEDIYGKNHPQ